MTDPKQDLARAAAGEPDAWEALLVCHYPALSAYARLRLSSPAAADKAVDEVFDRLHDIIGRSRPPLEVTLFRTLRAVTAAEAPPLEVRPPPIITTTSDGLILPPDPDHDAARWHEAFTALPAVQREILALRVAGRLPAELVARVLKRRRGVVRSLQDRALTALRAKLELPAATGDDPDGPRWSDESVLEELGRALSAWHRVPYSEGSGPPPRVIVAVRQRAIARRTPRRPERNGARHYSLLGSVIGGIIVATLFLGVVIGSALPGPVRAFARAIGLPVESAALTKAHVEISNLARALERSDGDAVRAAAERLTALMPALDAEERAAVEPVVRQLTRRLPEPAQDPLVRRAEPGPQLPLPFAGQRLHLQ